MDTWCSALVNHSFHQCFQQALGDFFHALEKDDPWWVSMIHPVNDDEETSLIYLLGFEHSVGLKYLGLVKEGHSRIANTVGIVRAEWEKFFINQALFYSYRWDKPTAIFGYRYFLSTLEVSESYSLGLSTNKTGG
jgi:hypothetical protein